MSATLILASSPVADGRASLAQGCGTVWPPVEDEKIGVRSIKVVERGLRATAVVGTFFGAERTLLGWSHTRKGVLHCDFEILYNDGFRISGVYYFKCKSGRRPALMNFVRASANGDHGCCTFSLNGLARSPLAFLDTYETADFGEQ